MSQLKQIIVGDLALSFMQLDYSEEGGQIKTSQLRAIGGPEILELAQKWRPLLEGAINKLEAPTGVDLGEILLRELIMKLKGQWEYPYKEEELCHCRAVATQKVDQAIVYGAHNPSIVSAQTSASTSCGSCQADVEAIIKYRLG